MTTPYEPVSARERLLTLDVLRGAALLGILLMNVLLFGMPFEAYSNLTLWGGRDGANLWAFVVQWVVFEGKMRAMFSMMFGAGLALFIERAVAREDSARAVDVFIRRMLWLLLIGIAHAYLIWYGDILGAYATCAVFIIPLRHLRARTLFATVAVVLILLTAMFAGHAFDMRADRDAAMAARAAAARGDALTEEQKTTLTEWDESRDAYTPAALQEEVDNYRSGYAGAMEERLAIVSEWHFVPVYFPPFADFWGLMLLGIALYKCGVLQGERRLGFYIRMASIGYVLGFTVNGISTYLIVASNFDPVASAFASIPHQFGRVAVALAHVALLIIVVKQGWVPWLTRRLAAVGQLALTNYIATSIICSLIFYRPGLGLMGQLQRYELYYVVAGVWLLFLVASPVWLARYRFGPLEWAWRSLTYWKRQPFLLGRESLPQAPAPSSAGAGA